jgi:hypothetical protein
LPCPPCIKAARFPQEKIFQDELPFAGKERPVADPARYFQIDGLRARLSSNLVESKAALAAEKRNIERELRRRDAGSGTAVERPGFSSK